MKTVVLRVDPVAPDPDAISQAAAVVRRGGLVAFPTETVYGLGANALDPDATRGIFIAKGRPSANPLIVHVAGRDEVSAVAAAWPAAADLLAPRFWPGPLTMVLPKRPHVPDVVTAGGPTVAVRVPVGAIARSLIRGAGVPIAAPSANPSNRLSPTCAAHVLDGLDGRIDLILDGGPTAGGIESTVLDLTVTPPRLLRPGLLSVRDLIAVLGAVDDLPPPSSSGHPLPSPGLLERHYAPRARLVCRKPPDDAGEAGRERDAHRRVGWLTYGPAGTPVTGVTIIEMPTGPAEYSARLYAALHDLDRAGADVTVVGLPPDGDDWRAVHDRLRRAAEPPGPVVTP